MTKRIYIAASSAEVDRAWSMREALRERGYTVTSTWIDLVLDAREHGHKDDSTVAVETLQKNAAADLDEVGTAHTLIYVRGDGVKSEGAAFEFGYFFFARSRRACVVFDSTDLPVQNIFALLVDRVRSMDELYAWLGAP